ncbi:MAG: hypothetical protein AVDCRST_MAG38-584 [uncultured Solirubrobacteraceae bacterium]|uniref:Solute-binding protein family 5 domain-containing protein n=1 Tax=uncultured Solirubrobacteraceae bacterium TaxID=1162706 RepID=A0A6J4RBM5_9ACTN|nr:MAG: hypothetical protein AVDCRST_MAG38-584 [uncultured Solirubrobacteraceae bacterium]
MNSTSRPGRAPAALLAMLAALLVLSGCGGTNESRAETSAATSGGGSEAGDVLRIPFLADMSVPDPDVFYDIEGNAVILSAYEGLLRYAPGSTKIVGALAEDWKVSKDRRTYTFALRDGVEFHSGAPMDAQAVKASLQRRLDVDQAPAYMLKDVERISTPDDSTVVIRLKQVVNPFLHYMASSWGPKIIGPAAIEENAGEDFGQEWMQTHADGTGPYELTGFERGRQYTLTRNEGYWGEKARMKTVLAKIVPDVGTQRLQITNGDLDVITHAFPASELESLEAGSDLEVLRENSFLRLLLYVNTHKAPFDDPEVRRGLRSAIDIEQLVAEGYAGTATASTGPYPPEILSDQPELPYAPDPAAAKAAADRAASREIVLGYSADESGVLRRVSELLQAKLAAAGYQVTLREVQLPQVYGYVEDLPNAPDLLLQTNTPDAAHPDTWARIVFESSGGLNFLGHSDKQIDARLEQALTASERRADELYREVGERVLDSDSMFFLGDLRDVMVVRSDITGIEHTPAYPWTLDLAKLERR